MCSTGSALFDDVVVSRLESGKISRGVLDRANKGCGDSGKNPRFRSNQEKMNGHQGR